MAEVFSCDRLAELQCSGVPDTSDDVGARARARSSLVASSNIFGVLIAASGDRLLAWWVADVERQAHAAKARSDALGDERRQQGDTRAVRAKDLGLPPLEPHQTLQLSGLISGLALSADQRSIALFADGALHVYELAALMGGAQQPCGATSRHALACGAVTHVSWCSTAPGVIAAVTDASRVVVLDASTGATLTERDGVLSAHWHPAQSWLAIGRADGHITILKIREGVVANEVSLPAPPADVDGFSVHFLSWIEPSAIAASYRLVEEDGEDGEDQTVDFIVWQAEGDDLTEGAPVGHPLCDEVIPFSPPPPGVHHRFHAQYIGEWKVLVLACGVSKDIKLVYFDAEDREWRIYEGELAWRDARLVRRGLV